MVCVLDQKKRPLMPCTPKRARLLLARGRAVVHRVRPFIIRLKDRRVEDCVLQPIALKIDPGSKTTGMALARVEATEEGEVHHALFLCEVQHRGQRVHDKKVTQANARRRRRSANLRHRAPRFDNRKIAGGWLPPSILSRVGNVVTWEVRAYLLVKYEYRCAYCGKTNVPFEIDHIQPRSRGGSKRVSNLVLACHECNQAKGSETASEFGHPEVEAKAKAPLKDAAAVNATRYKLVEALRVFGLPIGIWTGGRTRWNRARFGVEKTHAQDAMCVGELAGVQARRRKTLTIRATGRGQHCRTNFTKDGFPSSYLTRKKQVRGFKTGDRVRAVVPAKFKTAGTHVGRVQVRKSGSFDIETREREVEGVNAKYCYLVQRADGYDYAIS